MKKGKILSILTVVSVIISCCQSTSAKRPMGQAQSFDLKEGSIKGALIHVLIIMIIIIAALLVNIIQRQKTEQLLRQSEREYKELLMGIPNCVILIEEGEVRFINQYCIEFLGIQKDKKVTCSDLKRCLTEKLDLQLLDVLPKKIHTRLVTFEGIIKEVEVTIVAKSKDYSNKGYIILLEDRGSERLLYESAERDRIRSEFFANLSHEFKTPINLVLSTSQLLEQIQGNTEDMKKMLPNALRILNQNAYRLIRLVNNLIDLTMIDSGYLKLDLRNCNIVEITEDIAASAVKYAEDNNISLLFDTETEELEIALDADKYERIILNLISNAIKYNKAEGQILILLKRQRDEVTITVKDTGIGINKEMLPYIFERFMQVNKSFIRNAEGSGVGLALAKAFTELHGGSIEVNSQEGIGSEFIVRLPIDIVEEKEDRLIKAIIYGHKERNTKVELSDLHIRHF